MNQSDEISFAEVYALVENVAGWLTRDQAHLLWTEVNALAGVPHTVEIGSHRGRSTIVLAASRPDGRVTAIDPFCAGRLFGGPQTQREFEANIRHAGVADTISLVVDTSRNTRAQWTEAIDLLYIDGKHDYWTCSDDLRWAAFVPDGNHVLVHDAFSSIGVTLAVLRQVLFSSQLAFVDRTGSLARFQLRRPTLADRARIVAQLPWWLRNVFIKILLRFHLFAVARTFGHHDTADPY